jgi:hypothetical protein
VHYASGSDRIGWIKAKISEFVALFSSVAIESGDLPAAAFQLFQRFKLFSLFSKHIGFAEEAEWRVVYLRDRDAAGILTPMFDYRVGSRGIEPILKFKIEAKEGVTASDFSLEKLVDRIILGPTVSSPLALAAVVKMIEKIGRIDLAKRVKERLRSPIAPVNGDRRCRPHIQSFEVPRVSLLQLFSRRSHGQSWCLSS